MSASNPENLPNGWQQVRLGEVATFQRGFDLFAPSRISGDYPLIASNGQDGTHNECKVKAPGVVTGRSGTLGQVFFVQDDFWPLNTTLWVKDFHGNNVQFVYYFLKTLSLGKYNAGSGVPTLNRNHIHPLLVAIPPLAEQKTIAEILSSFDDKIDLLRRQNKTLEELAQVLFRQWFIANADETWQQQTIGKATTFAKGKKPNETQQVQFEGAVPQILMETFRAGKSLYCKPDGMVIAEENDILMVMDGSIGRVEIGYRGAVGSTIARYRPVSEFNYPFFIFHYLKTREKYIKANVIGSVIPHVDVGLVAGLTLRFPNLNKVQDFETHAEMLFKKKQANTRQIRTLANLRDTLLPKLMRGEIRV